jgi:hypothetical protein
MAVDLKPTAGMASAAERGLRLHEEGKSGDGLKPETVARAGRLARREEMNEDWVREMNAWFARHEADRRPGWDDPGEETPGFVAWLLWGGDAGQSFAARKVAELDREYDRSTTMDVERRMVAIEEDAEGMVLEKRADGRPVIQGYAVKWGSLSVDLGGFRERFERGAFDKVLNRSYKKADPIALFNHDGNIVLGRMSSGTLEVNADDKGLAYRIYPPASRADIVELVERGDVSHASFAFTVEKKGEAWEPGDTKPTRVIREASGLFDISVVTNPAYPASTTSVARRSLEDWLASQEVPAADEPEPAVVQRGLLPAAAASMRLKAAILRSRTC